jgi:hypothetical protein
MPLMNIWVISDGAVSIQSDSLSTHWSSRDDAEQVSESDSRTETYSASLTLSALIKAAAAKIGKPHLA